MPTGDKFDLKVDERVFSAIFDVVLRLLEPEPQLRWTAKEALQHEFFKMELGGGKHGS
jgi:serine/threonine protein kinase